jgi:broad specificity phosphatase PhoE
MNRLLLVRHGENPANVTREFSCRKVDHSLTEKGKLQAKQTAEFLSRVAVDEIWASPLRRAYETADAIARFHPHDVRILEDLREMDVGKLEGMEPQADAWKLYAAVLREWLTGNREASFPGGESRRQLVVRFRRALETLTQGRPGRTIVVVGHGGIFTHGVAELCGIVDQRAFFGLENHNCSISDLEVTREGPAMRYQLRSWASVSHLSGEAAELLESVPEAMRAKNL